MNNAGRWLFIFALVVLLPGKLLFVDLGRRILMAVNQHDLILGIPELMAMMIAETAFVVALIGGSIFVGVRALRSDSVARVTLLYLLMAILAYHLVRGMLFDTSRRLPDFLALDGYPLDLGIWIAVAAWTYGAVVTGCALFPRASSS